MGQYSEFARRKHCLAAVVMGVLLVMMLIWPSLAYAADPAPALITVAGDYADLQAVRQQIEQAGGRVGHIFPPNSMIARLTPDQADQLRALPQITTLTFEPLTLEPLTQASEQSDLSLSIWNNVFHGSPIALDFLSTDPFTDEVLIAPDLPSDDFSLAEGVCR